MKSLLRSFLPSRASSSSIRPLATAATTTTVTLDSPIPAPLSETSSSSASSSSTSALQQVAPITPTRWTPFSQRSGLIAKKRGMTALYDQDGKRWPVTVLQVDSCHVMRHEIPQPPHNLHTLQLGASDRKPSSVKKHTLGQFTKVGLEPKYHVKSFNVTEDALIPVGTQLSAAHFVPGQYVDVISKNIGKGFQGVMKRHGFRGQPASHGNTKAHRKPGAIGANQDPGKVWKGKKMPGRMGGKQRTTHNLLVHRIDTNLNLIFVRGSVHGFDDAAVCVRDALRNVTWKGKKSFIQGKEEGSWLTEGVKSLPMPTATSEMVKDEKWPIIMEWPGQGRAEVKADI